MSWKTVPNWFPDYDDLEEITRYHLNEGYGVYGYESKSSGRYYKKIKVEGSFENLLLYLGHDQWWKKWKPDKSWCGRFFGRWKRVP